VTTLRNIEAAAARIAGHVRRTPVSLLEAGVFPPAGPVWLKLEHLQHGGSFKARGAFNRILSASEEGTLPAAGVVTASGGNAGLGVAYAAAALGVPAEVYVPTAAPAVKVAALGALGAKVVQVGSQYSEANEAALERAAESGALFCHAYDQPEIVAGQGTLGLELFEQVNGALDTVVVAVGGGGLLAGVAAALAGRARVIGVEPVRAPTLHAALAAGGPVDVEVGGVAADALGARRLGSLAYDIAVGTGVGSVLVEEEAIVAARQQLWRERRLAIEHGAATALAALTAGAYVPRPGERVAVVVCGANTNPGDLA
jgi:threonine dehydratase